MRERRFFNSRVELRQVSSDDLPMIIGYAARWNVLSHDLGGFRERIQPGCFARSLASGKNDVKCLRDHNNSLILGRQRNETLAVREDTVGLKFMCTLNLNTSIGRDAYELVRSGMVDECSFAFQVDPDGDSWSEEKIDGVDGEQTSIRTLRSAQLFDVSVVSQPAYPTTSAHVPSLSSLGVDRSRSEFPEGYSLEIRSHVPRLSAPPERERRRQFVERMLSL